MASNVSFPFIYLPDFFSFLSRLKGKMFGEKKGCKCCCSTTLLLMYTYKMDMIATREKKNKGRKLYIDRYLSTSAL